MATEKLQLPPMYLVFDIDVKGAETGRTFSGTFKYVRPNLGKRAAIAKMQTRLSDDLKNLPYDVKLFNEMCATLFFCLEEKPAWWADANDGRDLYDLNVIEEVYSQCQKFEEDWYKRALGDRKADVVVSTKPE